MIIFSDLISIFPDLNSVRVHYWASDWGVEWEPKSQFATDPLNFGVTTGRSSKGHHPFFIAEDGERAFVLAICWSGNWKITSQIVGPVLKIEVISDKIDIEVLTKFTLEGGSKVALEKLITEFRVLDTRHRNPKMITEWNSWWPYEDQCVNEAVILQNAKIAKEIGLEVVVLDAGWFGPSETDTHWHDLRGDWALINKVRFPSGLEELGKRVRSLGIEFGIWLEFEAIGSKSKLTLENPEFIAQVDGINLGYICFGNPKAAKWAHEQAVSLIRTCGAKWLKIDFNVDPDSGCNREDHGHAATTGLASHIENLYLLLDELKSNFPDLTIEACSSGGLRWDFGIARHVDFGFASDPDWPEHALSVFWAASQFFPIEKLLGWCDSQWRGEHVHQNFKAVNYSMQELEFSLAISLLGGFGISQKLPDFSNEMLKLSAKYIDIFKKEFRPRYQNSPNLLRLTKQPMRELQGMRTVAFAIECEKFSPILTIFQLEGFEREKTIIYKPSNLKLKYRISNLVTGEVLINEHMGILKYENTLSDQNSLIIKFEEI